MFDMSLIPVGPGFYAGFSGDQTVSGKIGKPRPCPLGRVMVEIGSNTVDIFPKSPAIDEPAVVRRAGGPMASAK
jgi:hypothetical protein